MKYRAEDIFTPQGILEEVEQHPNLDFLMNIFNIPRAFGVSGFGGNWSVGMHSFAAALIAVFWSNFNNYPKEKRDKLVVQALFHDMHEAVTGDILPMFKSKEVKGSLNQIQGNIMAAMHISEDPSLKIDLKVIDLVAFLYEIKQVSPSILNPKKLNLAHKIAEKQLNVLLTYCQEQGIKKETIQDFLRTLEF